ncbi:hypothetical protein FDP41_004621 [Naegleria fowleri]|uniref:Protein kinase domain-containing protein n=1 Tax=Naegleria fowleri TaxID=5763 RepID=A0A6A5BSB1_NAEFO|nr:uncharacterized protein FDP41_004621 [Naegleria fowleri]KAF0976315.1 hypothetical protein FDP41_004621 [Naegleria fowleri]
MTSSTTSNSTRSSTACTTNAIPTSLLLRLFLSFFILFILSFTNTPLSSTTKTTQPIILVHAAPIITYLDYAYDTYLLFNSALENTTNATSCGYPSSNPCFTIQQQMQAIDAQIPSTQNVLYNLQLTIHVMSDISSEFCNYMFTNPNISKFASFDFTWISSKPNQSHVVLDCQGSEFFSFSKAPAILNITNRFSSFDVRNTIFKEKMMISSMNYCNFTGSSIYKLNENSDTRIQNSIFFNTYWSMSNVAAALIFRWCNFVNGSMIMGDVISKTLTVGESYFENVDLILRFSNMNFLNVKFNDNLVIFSQFQSLLMQQINIVTTKQTLITFGDSMVIRNSIFERSNLDLKIVSVRSVKIENSTFSNNYQTDLTNKALLQLTGLYTLSVTNSSFVNNRDLPMMSIYQGSIVNVQNSIFQFNTGGAIQIENMVGYFKFSSVSFNNCIFTGNVGQHGGAVAIGRTIGNLIISNCQFTKNYAMDGGALYLQQENVTISNCQFSGNSASQNGGSIFVKDTSSFSLQSSTLQNNMAKRGGALYLSSLTSNYIVNSICTNNMASYSGGCLFTENPMNPSLLQSVSNSLTGLNSAVSYGNNIATSIDASQFQFSVKYQNQQDPSITTITDMPSSLTLYPGQPVDITLKMKDKNNQEIKSIEQPITVSSVGNNISVLIDSLSSDYLTIRGLYLSVYSSNDLLTNTTLNLTVNSNMFFSIPVQIMTCNPEDSLQPMSSSGNAMICSKNPPGFPYFIVIPVVLIGGVILFIVGIIFGIAVLYGVYVIVKKLKKLEKKEKAEMKLEKTLIDKKFIFTGSTTTPPLNAHASGRTTKSVMSSITRPSIHYQEKHIIPIENLDVVKKIGEGSNGMVYLANWNGTEVAVKSLKLDYSELHGESEEFEREASLLSSLRHPNIVNFYGFG